MNNIDCNCVDILRKNAGRNVKIMDEIHGGPQIKIYKNAWDIAAIASDIKTEIWELRHRNGAKLTDTTFSNKEDLKWQILRE